MVTISRQIGSGGDEIARWLAQALGWRLLDSDGVAKLLERKGLPRAEVRAFTERRPDFWHRLSSDKDRYLQMLKLVNYEIARQGPCVMLGGGAQLLFADVPGVLRVRVVAPLEDRVQRLRETEGLEERAARQRVAASDSHREGFYRFLFHADWNSPALYDLVLNTRLVSRAGAADLIMRALASKDVAEQAPGVARRLESLYQIQQAVVAILFEQHLAIHDLRIAVNNGTVRIEGSAQDRPSLERAREVTASVFQHKKVLNRIRLEPRFAEILSGVHPGGANGAAG